MPVPSHNVLTCKAKISKKTKCQYCKNDNLFYFSCSHGSRVVFEFIGNKNWVKHTCKEREEALLMKFIRKERFNVRSEDINNSIKKYINKKKFNFISADNIQNYIVKEFNQLDLQIV